MNKRARKLFAVIYGNKIILINTTLKALYLQFCEIEKYCGSYITMYRRFHPSKEVDIPYFELLINDKTYCFQKVTEIKN